MRYVTFVIFVIEGLKSYVVWTVTEGKAYIHVTVESTEDKLWICNQERIDVYH